MENIGFPVSYPPKKAAHHTNGVLLLQSMTSALDILQDRCYIL